MLEASRERAEDRVEGRLTNTRRGIATLSLSLSLSLYSRLHSICTVPAQRIQHLQSFSNDIAPVIGENGATKETRMQRAAPPQVVRAGCATNVVHRPCNDAAAPSRHMRLVGEGETFSLQPTYAPLLARRHHIPVSVVTN
jgi:hypothetical protein